MAVKVCCAVALNAECQEQDVKHCAVMRVLHTQMITNVSEYFIFICELLSLGSSMWVNICLFLLVSASLSLLCCVFVSARYNVCAASC